MYTPSDTRLEWHEEGLLFESDSNECSGGIIEVMLGALGKIWHPPGDYEWGTGTSVSSIWLKIGPAWEGAIIRVGF